MLLFDTPLMFELAPAEEEVWHRDYLQLQRLLDDVDSSLPKFQPSPSLANLCAKMEACDEDDRGADRTTKPVPRLLQPGAKLGETCDSLRLTTRKRLAPDHNRPSSAAAPPPRGAAPTSPSRAELNLNSTSSTSSNSSNSIDLVVPRGAAPTSPSRAELNINSTSSNSIDLVVSGGGLKGYFLMGASLILRRQLARRGLHIARVAGASCGAWAAFFIMSGVSTEIWLKTYQMSRLASVRDPRKTILEICKYLEVRA